MSTITKEQLHERARQKVKSLEFAVTQTAFADSRAELEEELELARIELASLEAEPVYQFWNVKTHEWVECDKATHDSFTHIQRRVLYTAPPAPVSVPECFKRLLSHAYGMTMGHDWNKGTMAGHHRDKLCQAVEDCRTAMLQGADGNSPVIPDGWVACSERMPKKNDKALIFIDFNSDYVPPSIHDAEFTGSTFRRGGATVNVFPLEDGYGVTHWMPLPAEPQEVKSES